MEIALRSCYSWIHKDEKSTTSTRENAECRFCDNNGRHRDKQPMRISSVHRSMILFQMLVTFFNFVCRFTAASNPCPNMPASPPQRRTSQSSLIIKLLQSTHHTELSILIVLQYTRAQRRSMRHPRATLENRIILGAGFE
jgi:hypothetical protein